MSIAESTEDALTPIEYLVEHYPQIAESFYFAEYTGRLAANRDMHTIVTAEGETGVGKTTLAFAICYLLDLHGWTVEKATLDPREYANLYDRMPKGTWLLGDEWEQAMDTRRSTTTENVELSHNYAGKRYRQIFSCVTLPSRNWLDKRLATSSADFWIQCLEADEAIGKPAGRARVYRLREEEHYEKSITKKTEVMTWPILDGHPEFAKLEAMKAERFEGTNRSTYIHRDEFEEAKKNFWNKATKKARYNVVRGMYTWGLTQKDISEILELTDGMESLTQQRISDLVNAEQFEDVYKR